MKTSYLGQRGLLNILRLRKIDSIKIQLDQGLDLHRVNIKKRHVLIVDIDLMEQQLKALRYKKHTIDMDIKAYQHKLELSSIKEFPKPIKGRRCSIF